jgi:TPR repeat protein
MMYAEGDGVPKDAAEAYAWLNVASAKGDSMAKEELAGLERIMSAQQVHQAQERTKELARELSGEIRNLKELGDAIEREKKGA